MYEKKKKLWQFNVVSPRVCHVKNAFFIRRKRCFILYRRELRCSDLSRYEFHTITRLLFYLDNYIKRCLISQIKSIIFLRPFTVYLGILLLRRSFFIFLFYPLLRYLQFHPPDTHLSQLGLSIVAAVLLSQVCFIWFSTLNACLIVLSFLRQNNMTILVFLRPEIFEYLAHFLNSFFFQSVLFLNCTLVRIFF